MSVKPSITPCLIYNDAPAAIEFLCQAFGFSRHMVVSGAGVGEILHAQLLLDGCMIMLSSAKPTSEGPFSMVPPSVTGGLVTSCLSVALDDPDGHYARALAAGTKIIAAPHDNDYGGRGYECFDSEGNIWSFSSYDPWAVPPRAC